MHKKHHPVLFRQLKDVDMYLQYNKMTNLRLTLKNLIAYYQEVKLVSENDAIMMSIPHLTNRDTH